MNSLGKRSLQYQEGFRAAMKHAVTVVHIKAERMNDPHAAQVLNAMAFDLGLEIFKDKNPTPAQSENSQDKP